MVNWFAVVCHDWMPGGGKHIKVALDSLPNAINGNGNAV